MKPEFIITLFVIIFFSCGTENINRNTKNHGMDLKKYFEKEAEKLQHETILLEKIIVKDGKSDTLTLHEVQWKRELEMFMKTDLTNEKPSSYKADSVLVNGNSMILLTAMDSALTDKKIVITLSEGNISSVQIERRKKNSYYEMEHMMNYNPGKGYSILGRQQVRFAGETKFEIIGKFLN
jgi:hypothetical protein